jgi:hypothetical protein
MGFDSELSPPAGRLMMSDAAVIARDTHHQQLPRRKCRILENGYRASQLHRIKGRNILAGRFR